MVGNFGSYVTTSVLKDEDIVDLIYAQEVLRCGTDVALERDSFKLYSFCITVPQGTKLMLNNNEYCIVEITDTKQLVIPSDTFAITSCKVIGADCASVNCRYIY